MNDDFFIEKPWKRNKYVKNNRDLAEAKIKQIREKYWFKQLSEEKQKEIEARHRNNFLNEPYIMYK